MRAIFCEAYGGPEVLRYGDLPDPVARPGEVVVDIHAATVNGADWKVRAGDYGGGQFPQGLGRDFSGVVAANGGGVEDFALGDPVFGVCDVGHEGAYAEKIAIKASILARKPPTCPIRSRLRWPSRGLQRSSRSRTRSISKQGRRSWSREEPEASEASRFSWRSTSAPA